jgi:hypothetical protein
MKKLITALIVLFFCIILAGESVSEAATIKLNKSNLTLEEGKSYTLKVTGTTKTVKWSSNNKAVATVSSKGIVKAVKAGTATITATVASKKYTCKITVKEIFNAKKAVQSLSTKDYRLENGIIQIIKNNYSYPMQLTATIVYYDSDDMMLGKSTIDTYYFEKGKECVLLFYPPIDSNFNFIPFDHYKVLYTARSTDYLTSNQKNIKISSNIGADNVMLEVTNIGKSSSDYTLICILFYKEGEIVGIDYSSLYDMEPGGVDYIQFSFPSDENYNTIDIDDYEIYVNYSYNLDW